MAQVKFRICLLFTLAGLILLSGGVSCLGGETGSAGFGSCSATGISMDITGGAVAGSSAEAASEDAAAVGALSDESGLVDLPAPIAKNEDGVDASSIQFLSVNASPNDAAYAVNTASATTLFAEVSASGSEDEEESSVIGAVYGNLSSGAGTVGVVLDGEFVSELETSSGAFRLEIPSAWLERPVALVGFAQGSDAANGGAVSYPVTLFARYDAFVGDYTLDVQITNTGIVAEDSGLSADIQNTAIAVSTGGDIAFSALDAGGSPVLGRTRLAGGAFSVLSEELPAILRLLEYSATFDGFYGIERGEGRIVGVGAEGDTTVVGEGFDDPDGRWLRMHPSGRYYAASVSAVNPATGEATLTIGIFDILDPSYEVVVPVPAEESAAVTELSFDWLDAAHIVAIKAFDDGFYEMAAFEVAGIMAGVAIEPPPPGFVFTSDSYMAHPVADSGSRGRFVYACTADSGRIGLCGFDLAIGDLGVVVSGDFDVRRASYSSEGGLVAFDAEFEENGAKAFEIGVYAPGDGTTQFLGRGLRPRLLSNDDPFHVVHLVKDTAGAFQIALKNLHRGPDYSVLAVNMPFDTLPENASAVIPVLGGLPPYVFELADGPGAIETDTGLYTATGGTGEVVVRVGDALGGELFVNFEVTAAIPVPAIPPETCAPGENATATLDFETDYLDLDGGDIESADPFAPLAGPWDVKLAYNAVFEAHAVVFQNAALAVEIAHLPDSPYAEVTSCDVASASFTTDIVDVGFDAGRTILVRTDTGAVFKLGLPVENPDFTVTFTYAAIE